MCGVRKIFLVRKGNFWRVSCISLVFIEGGLGRVNRLV